MNVFVLISYDIEKDRTRTRLSKKLKDFGPRVQYSVFEADLQKKDEFAKLKKILSNTDLGQKDSIRLYVLCNACCRKVQIWGQGEISMDKDYIIA